MITIYGLTDSDGRIRYIGQTSQPKERLQAHLQSWWPFILSGMHSLEIVKTNEEAVMAESAWIARLGFDALENKQPHVALVHRGECTTPFGLRIPSKLYAKLKREAGLHGSVPRLVRSILEKHFAVCKILK